MKEIIASMFLRFIFVVVIEYKCLCKDTFISLCLLSSRSIFHGVYHSAKRQASFLKSHRLWKEQGQITLATCGQDDPTANSTKPPLGCWEKCVQVDSPTVSDKEEVGV